MRCYILLGGQSSRMGFPKQSLELGGRTFLERVASAAEQAFDEVVVVGRGAGVRHGRGRRIEDDPRSEAAPLSGVRRALADTQDLGEEHAWILAVDYPLITGDLLAFLRNQFCSTDAELLVPFIGERPQMLCAGYLVSVLRQIEKNVAAGSYALRDLLKQCRAHLIDEKVISSRFDVLQLRNVNTPEDYAELRRLYEETHARR